jgi:hypothetical protein
VGVPEGHIRALADQLIAEYAGAVPPGQVLATVLRAHLVVARKGDLHVRSGCISARRSHGGC